MIQIISFFICSIIFIIYLEIKKKKYKKLANSPIFSIIERDYNRWYSKENRGSQINKKTTSVFEIDQAVNLLKKKLVEKGITRNQIQIYIKFLDDRSMEKNSLFDILVGILTFIGTNTFLRELMATQFNTLFDDLLDNFLKEEIIFWIFNFIILFVYFLVLIFVFYKIIYIDDLHKESQKIFILNRIDEIWDFYEFSDKINKEEAIKEFMKGDSQVIFTHLETNESKILDKVIGNTMNEYSLFFIYLCSSLFRRPKVKDILEWLSGIIFLNIICLFIFAFSVGYANTNVYYKYLLLFCVFVFIFIFYIFYSSFLDKYQNQSENKKGIYYSGYTNEKINVKLLIERRVDLNTKVWLSLIVLNLVNLIVAITIIYFKCFPCLDVFCKEIDIPLLLLFVVSCLAFCYSQRIVENTENSI